MKQLTTLLFLTVLTSSIYADVKISYTQGPVAVYRGSKWVEASNGMQLSSDEKIRTLADSKAVLLVDNSSKIWVNRNTEMVIKDNQKGSWFDMLAGKLRARVKLIGGKGFQIKTPIAVASIRGTDLIISSDGELAVLEGKVEFSDLNLNQVVEVGQGQVSMFNPNGELAAPRNLSESEKISIEHEWTNFDVEQSQSKPEPPPAQDLVKEEPNKKEEELRTELHRMVRETKNEIARTRAVVDEIRESDLSSGRTMRDVHGNLVRVEQLLLRPDDYTIQLLNLTKREEYIYAGRYTDFTVENKPRLDVMDVCIRMNMPLPDQITAWPGYISDKGDDMYPESVILRFSNNFHDEMASIGEWRYEGDTDYEGNILNDDQLVFKTTLNGWDVDPDYDPANPGPDEESGFISSYNEGTNGDGSDTNELYGWGISPQMKLTKNGETKYVRLFTEAYGINNGGKILNLNDFTSSSENPFAVLKQVGMEHIVFCRVADAENSKFFNSNLDLVVTPDLIIALAEKLAGQVGEINNNSSNASSIEQ